MHNAKAGGEIGANGEFYKGGQFVADTEDWVKGSTMSDAERKEGVSLWDMCGDNWTFAEKWDDAQKKYVQDYVALGSHINPKKRWGTQADAAHTFFGYMLQMRLDKCPHAWGRAYAHLPNEVFWNCYAAAFGRDGIWLQNCRYHGKPVSLFVNKTDEQLAMLREYMAGVAAKFRWYDDIEAEREAARKAAIVSKHIGAVGDKMELEVEVTATIPFESDFGGGTVFKFLDGDGNELVWMTSTALWNKEGREVEKGDKLRIKFTVKGHDTYCDVLQTKIFRVKAVA